MSHANSSQILAEANLPVDPNRLLTMRSLIIKAYAMGRMGQDWSKDDFFAAMGVLGQQYKDKVLVLCDLEQWTDDRMEEIITLREYEWLNRNDPKFNIDVSEGRHYQSNWSDWSKRIIRDPVEIALYTLTHEVHGFFSMEDCVDVFMDNNVDLPKDERGRKIRITGKHIDEQTDVRKARAELDA